ncbi:MAG: InlB B-repeat-containing protein [Oscillospiraceae bacterium]|jgi:M6 family metalloprotease-like protein/uncharacterized repeat protein (TIGR02543 family)|nr:InlB B-repeat-containing protein [Oscillospiraceae bacterium]
MRKGLKKAAMLLLFAAACVIIISFGASAIPAAPDSAVYTQPNGLCFNASQLGDEYFNYTLGQDDSAIIQGAEGYWYYAKIQQGIVGRAALEPTGAKYLIDPKPAFAATKESVNQAKELWYKEKTMQSTFSKAPAIADGVYKAPSYTGNQKLLVILVNFNDVLIQNNDSSWATKIFGTGAGSVRHYYRTTSNNKIDLVPATEGYVGGGAANDGIVKVSIGYNHLNNGGDLDYNNTKLAMDAIKKSDAYVDYSTFDTNGNGVITADELHIMIIAAGYEAAIANAPSPNLWGHCAAGAALIDLGTADGKRFTSYTQFGEMHASSTANARMATIGIICHEFGHDLGLPDLYNVSSTGIGEGLGGYSLMSTGAWGKVGSNDIGSSPVLMDAYCRGALGVITPQEVAAGGSYDGYVASASGTAKDTLKLPINANEYFLVENRQFSSYDEGLKYYSSSTAKGGLAIYRINQAYDQNYSRDQQLVTILEADGSGKLTSGAVGALYNNNALYYTDNGQNYMLTQSTNPSTVLADKTSYGWFELECASASSTSMRVKINPKTALVTYTIAYNANGGTGAPASQSKIKDVSLQLRTEVPTRSGYSFLGWASSSTATTAQYQPGDAYTVNGNATLYAVWESDYDDHGNTFATATTLPALTAGQTYTLAASFEKVGDIDVFKFTAPVTGVYTISTAATFNVDGFVFDSNQMQLAYQSGGQDAGTNQNIMGTVNLQSGSVYYLKLLPYVGLKGSYSFTIKVPMPTYTIAYHANGGSGAPESQSKAHDATLILSSVIPTKMGYSFLGWSTSSTATTAQYSAGGSYTANASATLYAVWSLTADDHGNTFGTATNLGTIPSTGTYSLNAKLETGIDVDFFKFTAPVTGLYTIFAESNLDTEARLYDSAQGQLTPASGGSDSGAGYNFSLTINLTAGSSYYIEVSGFTIEDVGSYTLKISPPAATYAINYYANGGAGAPPNQYKTQDIPIVLSTIEPTWQDHFFEGWSTSSTGSVQYRPGETYTTNAALGLYAVWSSIADDHGNTPETATLISLTENSTYHIDARFEIAGDRDAFKFVAPSSGKYRFVVQSSARIDIDCELQNSGLTKLNPTEGGVDVGTDFHVDASYTLIKGQTYYFIAFPYNSANTGSYAIDITVPLDTVQTYTVTYNANGGAPDPASQTKSHDVALTLSTTVPVRANYVFLGWARSNTTSIAQYAAGGTYNDNANVILYAVWKEATYAVTYNANGGTGAPAAQVKTYNVALILSSGEPTKSGSVFKGWSTNSSASTAQYQPGDTYTGNAALTLYAVWQSDNYTVSYNANGGSGAPAAQSKVHGTTLILSSQKPERTGYTFQGWATSSSATAAQYQAGDSYTGNADLTLYAVWKAVTYAVTYDANGGANAPAAQAKTHGTPLVLSSSVPTRTGRDFVGWATSSTATAAEYAAGASYTTDAPLSLYAVWRLKTYTVSYNANGGTSAPAAQIKTYGEALTLTSAEPVNAGYAFMGWSSSSTATVAQYQAGETYSTNASITFYAVWESQIFTVSYNANGGSGAPTNQTKSYGVSLKLSTRVPTRSGYDFIGWASTSTATVSEYAAGASYTQNASIILYAVWQPDTTTTTSTTTTTTPTTTTPATSTSAASTTTSTATTTSTKTTTTTTSTTTTTTTTTTKVTTTTTPTTTTTTTVTTTTTKPTTTTTTTPTTTTTTTTKPTTTTTSNSQTFTVSYNANGGMGAPANQTKLKDVPLTLSSTVPTRSTYTFLGWASSSTATTAEYAPGASYTANANLTLHAVWQAADDHGNTFDTATLVDINTNRVLYGVLERTGDVDMFKFTAPVTGDYTFTSVSGFDLDGVVYSSSQNKLVLVSGGPNAGVNDNFKIEYRLLEGSVYYLRVDSEEGQIGSYQINIAFPGDKVTYTVSYNANGGTGAPESQTKTQGTVLKLSTAVPTRSGYTFQGWSTSSTATIATYAAGANYGQEQSVTLYAVWKKNSTGINVKYLSGSNRVDTANAIAKSGWPSGSSTVVLANGSNFADALAGGPLAKAYNAPILLTLNQNTLESSVLSTISALKVKNIIILGGASSVRDSYVTTLKSKGYTVTRYSGGSRYETAVEIAKALKAKTGGFETVFIADGTNFPDALAASPIASLKGAPILFTRAQDKSNLEAATQTYLKSISGVNKIYVLGGTSTISAAVENQAKATGSGRTTARVAGASRYDTAIAIYKEFKPEYTPGAVCIATGQSFPDALAGSAYSAKIGAPLLLLNNNLTSPEIKSIIQGTADTVYVFGGAVNEATINRHIK